MDIGYDKDDILSLALGFLICAVLLGLGGWMKKESWMLVLAGMSGLLCGILVFLWTYKSIRQLENK